MEPYGYRGSYLRVERADRHFAEVERLAAGFHEEWREIGALLGTVNEDGFSFDLRGVDVPEELSIAAGETIYNLRAALDYLVFALSWHDSGERPSGERAELLQFPITSDGARFKRAAARRLPGVSPEHVAMLEDYQPYNGCVWTTRLADLSNADKHRHLLDLVGRVDPRVEYRDAYLIREGAQRGSDGRYDAEDITPIYDAQMDAAFADGSQVAATLALLCHEVRALVERFAPEFRLLPVDPKPSWPPW